MTSNNPTNLSEKELAAAYDGGAPLVNRFIVAPTPHGLRIAFLELTPSSEPQFRAAVTLGFQDADELAKLLARVIGDMTAQIGLNPDAKGS